MPLPIRASILRGQCAAMMARVMSARASAFCSAGRRIGSEAGPSNALDALRRGSGRKVQIPGLQPPIPNIHGVGSVPPGRRSGRPNMRSSRNGSRRVTEGHKAVRKMSLTRIRSASGSRRSSSDITRHGQLKGVEKSPKKGSLASLGDTLTGSLTLGHLMPRLGSFQRMPLSQAAS